MGFLPLGNNKLYVWVTFHPKYPMNLFPDIQHRELKEAPEYYSHFEGFGVPAILKELVLILDDHSNKLERTTQAQMQDYFPCYCESFHLGEE